MRGFFKNWTKFLAMSLIIALGFAFIFGVSITPSKVRDSFDMSLKERKISDFNLKSTSSDGFLDSDIEQIQEGFAGVFLEKALVLDAHTLSGELSFYDVLDDYGVKTLVKNGYTPEKASSRISFIKSILPDKKEFFVITPSLMSDGNDRLFAFPDAKSDEINRLNLIEGNFPSSDGEIMLDSLYHKETENIGGSVLLFGNEYKISGYVSNPLYYARTNEPNFVDYSELDSIYYHYGAISEVPSLNESLQTALLSYIEETFSSLPEFIKSIVDLDALKELLKDVKYSLPSQSDLFLRFPERDSYNLFSEEYSRFQKEKGGLLEGAFPSSTYVLSLSDNYSCYLLSISCKKMDSICLVIPIFFLSVSALVVSISMSRMIEEERSEIACLSSLGYRDMKISKKYVYFAAISTLMGIGLGLLVGYFLVFPIIYEAFNYPYYLPGAIASSLDPWLTFFSAIAMVVVILGITIAQLRDTLHPLPAALLQPKTPAAGNALKIERTPLWKKFPFRFKSSIRNLVRFKKRLWMTSISVGGSTAIVFIGFALLDIVNALGENSGGGAVASSIVPVSYFLIVFAILLAALVLYNLTNMSITERSRELATLEVLGYYDKENVAYLYRETGVMAALGVLLGVPIGVGIMRIVVIYLEFGSLADIKWSSYLLPVLVIASFAVLVDLLLLPKIKKIDMISSLKSVD